MKRNKKSRIFSIFTLSVSLLLIVVAIGAVLLNNQTDANENVYDKGVEDLSNRVIDDYVFIAQSGFMHLDIGKSEAIHGLSIHNDLIYYLYVEYPKNPIAQTQSFNSDISEYDYAVIEIRGINQSGVTMDSITIPTFLSDLTILGFDIENTGFSIITYEYDFENEDSTINYTKYDFAGNAFESKVLKNAGFEWFPQIAYFEKSGAIAISGFNSQFEDTILFWDKNKSFIREEKIISTLSTFTDNGTFISLVDKGSLILQEVDFVSGERLYEYSFPFSNPTSLHLAEKSSPFDYYIISMQQLFGYVLETGEVEPILDFQESFINLSRRHHVVFLTDGSIVISQERPIIETQKWMVELAILNPVHRSIINDRDYILLAGFQLRPLFIEKVMEFNRSSAKQQIVIHDYWDIDDDNGYRQAIERLHFDILSGNIPDIILFEDPTETDLIIARDALIKQGALMDLYPFIDADPTIHREEFFPNILKGYENADGTLPVIGNQLMITTMVTTNSLIKTENWNVSEFLSLMERNVASGNTAPLGNEMTGTRFLTMMLEFIGNNFINDNGTCDFEGTNFNRFLDLTTKIPANTEYSNLGIDYFPNFNALHKGEQVIDLVGFAGLPDWKSLGVTVPEVFNYIGLPSATGGIHDARLWGTFSIFNNAQNPDAAWQFVREVLLPGATEQTAFSIRIEEFEKRVAESTLSTHEKNAMREIMNQATVQRPLSGTILMIIKEDIIPFSRNTRSAAETTRIIQSRASIYLSEQS